MCKVCGWPALLPERTTARNFLAIISGTTPVLSSLSAPRLRILMPLFNPAHSSQLRVSAAPAPWGTGDLAYRFLYDFIVFEVSVVFKIFIGFYRFL